MEVNSGFSYTVELETWLWATCTRLSRSSPFRSQNKPPNLFGHASQYVLTNGAGVTVSQCQTTYNLRIKFPHQKMFSFDFAHENVLSLKVIWSSQKLQEQESSSLQ